MLARTPEWQRQRAMILHREFLALETAAAHGASVTGEIRAISQRLSSQVIRWTGPRGHAKEKSLRASPATLYRALADWRAGGRSIGALLHDYRSAGHHRPMPPELDAEIRRLASLATGGRNKDQLAPATFAARDLHRRWHGGEPIPGLGTWQDWWRSSPETAALALPAGPPDFPFSQRTITRHCGHVAIRKLGNVGFAAAKKHLPSIERDYAQLRKAELFTLDDVRLDLVAIDEFTSQVVTVEAYIMMEVGSRFIPSFVLRSGGKVKARDVKALIAAGLAKTGLPVGYTCNILFERGTLACSDELKDFLEGVSDGRIRVRKTGMIDNVRWIGAAADKARGNSAGKAVIESFNRSLHYRLLHLPGQRGNTRENQPLNLGVEDRDRLQGSGDQKGRIGRPRRASARDAGADTLVAHAERLARFKRAAAIHGFDCDLQFPLLTVAQLEAEVAAAIDAHNREPGRDYQGHRQQAMIQGPGGVWTPLNQVTV
jgi:hypothetical protein